MRKSEKTKHETGGAVYGAWTPWLVIAPHNVFKGLDPITSFFKGGEKLMIFMKVNKILPIMKFHNKY